MMTDVFLHCSDAHIECAPLLFPPSPEGIVIMSVRLCVSCTDTIFHNLVLFFRIWMQIFFNFFTDQSWLHYKHALLMQRDYNTQFVNNN